MGRLFWKIFFFILLAQLVATVGIGGALWLKGRTQERRAADIGMGPFSSSQVEVAADTLRYRGADALKALLQNGYYRHPVYAVAEDGSELLGRPVRKEMIDEARNLLGTQDRHPAVREVRFGGAGRYLLFSVSDRLPGEGPMAGGPPFGGPPGRGPFFHPFLPTFSALLASLIFAVLLAWYFSKPIRSLRRAFETLASGKLDTRVASEMGVRHDELSDLGQDFDRMARQLEALVEGQQKLLHDISHELRSPLARMQAAIGLARQNPAKAEASMARIEKESDRMDRLVGELLTLSRLDAGAAGLQEEEIDIGEFLGELVEDARLEAQGAGCELELVNRYTGTLRGYGELLRRAVENVVRNAIKYGAAGGKVTVLAEADGRELRIGVFDGGLGVPESELQSIFEPFYRGVGSAKSNDGHGLGLSIAKRIVEMRGGAIRAMNREGGGLRVDIVLPLTAPRA